jgi:hypothetical protein
MRAARIGVVVALALGLFTGLSSTVTQAAASTDTALAGATLTIDKTSLTRAELATMTVTLHLTDPTGVEPSDRFCPCAYVAERDTNGFGSAVSTQSYNTRVIPLHLTAGNETDGEWTGTTLLGAENAGRWVLRALVAGTLRDASGYASYGLRNGSGPAWLLVDGPGLGAVANVTGSDWPIITLDSFRPAVAEGSPYVVSGAVHYYASGVAAANVALTLLEPLTQLRTDSSGHWHFSEPAPFNWITMGIGGDGAGGLTNFAGIKEKGIPFKTAFWVVTIRTSSTRAPATISGAVLQHDYNRYVQLQKKVGTTWRTVKSFLLSTTSNRYSFRVTSAGSYRVHADAGSGVIRGYSKVVVLS